MPEYRDLLPEGTDEPTAIEDEIYEELQDQFPDWEPADGNLETWIIKALAFRMSELFEVTTDVADEIFAAYGQLRNIERFSPEQALGTATFTVVSADGYTIDAGLEIAVPKSGNDLVPFAVVEDVIIPQGETSADVAVAAVDPGTDANDLTGTCELIDPVSFVQDIEITEPTEGGVDEEPLADYLTRLQERLLTAAETPILPRDFEIITRTFHPFVDRAVARDGYDADAETDDNPRTISLAVTDDEGEPLTTGQKETVQATLEALREVNWDIYVIDVDYTEIDVAVSFEALANFAVEEVEASVQEALEFFFQPKNWGQQPFRTSDTVTNNPRFVRYFDVVALVDSVVGVDYITTLTINADGDAPDTEDIELVGPVPLTRPGTFTFNA